MKNPSVSIIVPVYNAEKYLSRCVDSILAQTYSDFELLLIDDGSTDNSGTICDEYAEADNRVSVYHKMNGGVGSARNCGLDNAKGEWISFVDADDLIMPNFLEDALSYPGDIKIMQCITFETENYKLPLNPPENIKPIVATNFEEVKNYVSIDYWNNYRTAIWGKVFHQSLIGNVRFKEQLFVGEDSLFMLQVFEKTESLSFIPGIYYIYFKLTHLASKYRLGIDEAANILNLFYKQISQSHLKVDNIMNGFFMFFSQCAKKAIYAHPIKFINHDLFRQHAENIFKTRFPRLLLLRRVFSLVSETISCRFIYQWKRISKSL